MGGRRPRRRPQTAEYCGEGTDGSESPRRKLTKRPASECPKGVTHGYSKKTGQVKKMSSTDFRQNHRRFLDDRPRTATVRPSVALALRTTDCAVASSRSRPHSSNFGGQTRRRPVVSPSEKADSPQELKRTLMLHRVTSINRNFELDFDYDRLPRIEGQPNRLKVSFVVPKHQLKSAGEREGRTLCFVSPAKLERAFLISSVYVGRWGANPRGRAALVDSRARYRGVLEFLCTKIPVLVGTAIMDRDTKSIRFVDGKHRFCVYRDLGLSCIPVLVPAAQATVFKRRFQAPRAERRVVRKVTRIVSSSKARFSSAHNAWGAAAEDPPCSASSVTQCYQDTSASSGTDTGSEVDDTDEISDEECDGEFSNDQSGKGEKDIVGKGQQPCKANAVGMSIPTLPLRRLPVHALPKTRHIRSETAREELFQSLVVSSSIHS